MPPSNSAHHALSRLASGLSPKWEMHTGSTSRQYRLNLLLPTQTSPDGPGHEGAIQFVEENIACAFVLWSYQPLFWFYRFR